MSAKTPNEIMEIAQKIDNTAEHARDNLLFMLYHSLNGIDDLSRGFGQAKSRYIENEESFNVKIKNHISICEALVNVHEFIKIERGYYNDTAKK